MIDGHKKYHSLTQCKKNEQRGSTNSMLSTVGLRTVVVAVRSHIIKTRQFPLVNPKSQQTGPQSGKIRKGKKKKKKGRNLVELGTIIYFQDRQNKQVNKLLDA